MDRRGFLRSTAAIGSGLVLTAGGIARPEKGPGDSINLALIGAGAQGQVLLKSCLEAPGIRIRAVCDIWTDYNLRKVSQKVKLYEHEHNRYADYREMLEKEKDLDGAIIATPDFLHSEQTVACMKAGLHVYCERPMSNTIEGARKMVQAARETGKLLQIGHQRRSNPIYLHCREKLLGEVKLLGRITAMNGQRCQPPETDRGWPRRFPLKDEALKEFGYASMHQFRNWRWYGALGSGPWGEYGTDGVDVFNWLTGGRPSSVQALGGTDYYDRKTHELPDTVMALFNFETKKGRIRAFFQSISSSGHLGHYERIMGDQGSLMISEEGGRAGVYREPAAPEWERWVNLGYLVSPARKKEQADEGDDKSALGVRDSVEPVSYYLPVKFEDPYHKPHLDNFFQAIRGKAKLNCPAQAGFEAAVVVLKAAEALEARRTLDLKPGDFTA